MKEIRAYVNRILDLAADLDGMGMTDTADVLASMVSRGVERHAQIVSGSGGVQEYFERLVQLAMSKGVEYAKARMNENRIVVLNDGTPLMKFADPQAFRARVIDEAIKRGAKSNPAALKNMQSTRRFDPHSAAQARQKYQGWSQGQPSPATQGLSTMTPTAKPVKPAQMAKSAPGAPKQQATLMPPASKPAWLGLMG